MDFIYSLFSNEMYIWIFITAVVYTFVGKHLAYNSIKHHFNTNAIIEYTVDKLIKDGYIKTEGHGENTKLIKHWDIKND